MQIDEKNFFIAKVVPEISAKNTYFKNNKMYIFVTDCTFIVKLQFLKAKQMFEIS